MRIDLLLAILGGYGISFFALSIHKAEKHLEYWRMIYPKEFSSYKNWIQAYGFQEFNMKVQFLIAPYFCRRHDKENVEAEILAKQVIRLVKFQFGMIVMIVVSLIVMIVLFAK